MGCKHTIDVFTQWNNWVTVTWWWFTWK